MDIFLYCKNETIKAWKSLKKLSIHNQRSQDSNPDLFDTKLYGFNHCVMMPLRETQCTKNFHRAIINKEKMPVYSNNPQI